MSARLPDHIHPPVSSGFRLTRSNELGGSLQVTVESRQLLRVRRAIVRCGCDHVGIVRAAAIAGGTRVRMLIALRPEDVARIMDAIMGEVSSGEFGRITTPRKHP